MSAAALYYSDCRSKSARLPLGSAACLHGIFTPSIANSSRRMRPCRSQTVRIAPKT